MDLNQFQQLKRRLLLSVEDLRVSIDEASEKMTQMYGVDHFVVVRLNSYYDALDKQEEYISELDNFIECRDFESLNSAVSKIQAIAEMIKSDAKSLLSSLMAGEPVIPDDTICH